LGDGIAVDVVEEVHEHQKRLLCIVNHLSQLYRADRIEAYHDAPVQLAN
jgi:hypothetical protein